jgi:Tfp pilus assembly protein PilO
MSISAAYEGSYANLTKFVNLLDKSPRFLIIESLTAAPQQSNAGDLLSVSIKLDTFVREQPGNPI